MSKFPRGPAYNQKIYYADNNSYKLIGTEVRGGQR